MNALASFAILVCLLLGISGEEWARNIAVFFICTGAVVRLIVALDHMEKPRVVGIQRPIVAVFALATVTSAAAAGWFLIAAAEFLSVAFWLAATTVKGGEKCDE